MAFVILDWYAVNSFIVIKCLGKYGVRVAIAVCCAAQHAILLSTAQHPYTLQHNTTTGILYT